MISEEHLQVIHNLAIKTATTQELTKELKKRGLGVFNMSYPFKYLPGVLHQHFQFQETKLSNPSKKQREKKNWD